MRADKPQLRQLHTAAEELSSGLSAMLGKTVNATCCTPPPEGTKEYSGTLYVEVGSTSSSSTSSSTSRGGGGGDAANGEGQTSPGESLGP